MLFPVYSRGTLEWFCNEGKTNNLSNSYLATFGFDRHCLV